MKRLLLLVPLVLFLLVAAFLFRGLFLDPAELPSALIGKPLPAFSLPAVESERTLTRQDFQGPALVNVWGTWCVACRDEHPVLNQLKAQGVTVYGVNYKDDNAAARKWLAEFGNPYRLGVRDEQGSLGIDLGVYGAPETFVIDRRGVIRHKVVGILSEQLWREQLAPLWQQLQDERP
jgi:cytochrome c biogenesis protein CcmG/thiol:disulfide interchange protein DsbE